MPLRYNNTEAGPPETIRKYLTEEYTGPSNLTRCQNCPDPIAPQALGPPKPFRVPQTPSRARPFARLARMTALPPRVRMRTRNP